MSFTSIAQSKIVGYIYTQTFNTIHATLEGGKTTHQCYKSLIAMHYQRKKNSHTFLIISHSGATS